MNPSGQAVHMAWNSGMQSYRQMQRESACVHTNALQMISCQVPDCTAPGVQSSHFLENTSICLHTEPDGPAFQKAPAFTFLYKSSFTGLEEAAADNTTVSLVCGRNSAKFFQHLEKSGHPVNPSGNGIYQIHTGMPVHSYAVIMPEPGKPECSWLELLIRLAGEKCQEKHIYCPSCSFQIAEF